MSHGLVPAIRDHSPGPSARASCTCLLDLPQVPAVFPSWGLSLSCFFGQVGSPLPSLG